MLEDRENFVLIALEKYLVEQNLLKARLSESDLRDFKQVQRALGQLPHGHVGDFSYNQMRMEVENFVSKIARFTGAAPKDSLEIDVHIAGFDLRGQVSGMTEYGQVNIRYARKNTKNILSTWIHHLAMCLQAPPEYPRASFLVCKESAIQFGPVHESKGLLENLLNLFRRGLEKPIHFFPKTSHEYAQQKLIKSLSDQSALAKADHMWRGGDPPGKYTKAEFDDRYYDLCFRRLDPLDDEFTKMALAVFEPLFGHSEDIRLE
jgi:exodeoxyribonuclease V gamma subunit